jgi:hypothetical protein
MSLVRVDLLCFVKARDAAFLRRPDAAMHPKIAGFSEGLSGSDLSCCAHDKNTATPPERISPCPPQRLGEPYMLTDFTTKIEIITPHGLNVL